MLDVKKHLIVLNGPPRSGKDTLAEIIQAKLWNLFTHDNKKVEGSLINFKDPLLDIVYSLLPKYLPYEDMKTSKHEILGGITGRDLMIKISEDWIKPSFGRDLLGKLWVESVKNTLNAPGYEEWTEVILCADCGFYEEAQCILNVFSPEEVTWVSMEREGCSFDNDSRSYLTDDQLKDLGFKYVHKYKNDTLDNLQEMAYKLLDEIGIIP